MSKTSREKNFQARANVWSTYERMAHELGVGMDDLINEALVAYAATRGYTVDEMPPMVPAAGRTFEETRNPPPSVSPLDRAYASEQSDEDDEFARTSTRGLHARPGRPPPREEIRTAPPARHVPVALGKMPTAPRRPLDPPMSSRMTASPPTAPPPMPMANRPAPPPLPRVGPGSMSTNAREAPPPLLRPREAPRGGAAIEPDPRAAAEKRLVLTYRGRSVDVEKQRFLIGRSKTQADLLVDDPNVSRQHAAIERVGYVWYLVDLGSTNGVQIAGERITRRALAEGDVIAITSHEIRCSFR